MRHVDWLLVDLCLNTKMYLHLSCLNLRRGKIQRLMVISRFCTENIRHSLTEQLISVDIHKILFEKQLFRKIGFSNPVDVIALSSTAVGFHPVLFFEVL